MYRMHWSRARIDELESPFLRGGGERPLRITFHTSGLRGLSSEEKEALEALHELANLPEIEALTTIESKNDASVDGATSHPSEEAASTLGIANDVLRSSRPDTASLAFGRPTIPVVADYDEELLLH